MRHRVKRTGQPQWHTNVVTRMPVLTWSGTGGLRINDPNGDFIRNGPPYYITTPNIFTPYDLPPNAVNIYGPGYSSSVYTGLARTLSPPTGEASMILVLTKTGAPTTTFVGSADGSVPISVSVPASDGSVLWQFGGNSGVNQLVATGISNYNGAWVFTGGASGLRMYFNGRLVASSSTPVTCFASEVFGFGLRSGIGHDPNACYNLLHLEYVQFSDQEALDYSLNPWSIFGDSFRHVPPAVAGTISRPGTDVSVAGWSFTAASLSASINEAARADASYAQAPYGVAAAITTLDLPLVAGSYTLSFAGQYLAANASSGQFRFTALDSSNTSLGVSAWTAVTSSAALYTVALTVSGGTATRLKIEIQA